MESGTKKPPGFMRLGGGRQMTSETRVSRLNVSYRFSVHLYNPGPNFDVFEASEWLGFCENETERSE